MFYSHFLSLHIYSSINSIRMETNGKNGSIKDLYIYIDVCTCIVFPFAIYSERFQRFPNSFCLITCIYFCNANEKRKEERRYSL